MTGPGDDPTLDTDLLALIGGDMDIRIALIVIEQRARDARAALVDEHEGNLKAHVASLAHLATQLDLLVKEM